MATDYITSLFGGQMYDPQQAALQQQQAFQQSLSQAVTPQQFIATVGSNLGGQLGQGVTRMFGGQTNQEKVADIMKQVSQYPDPVTRAYEAERLLNAAGLTQQAEVMRGRIEELRKADLAEQVTKAQLGKIQAETAQKANLQTVVAKRVAALQAKFPNEDPAFYEAVAQDAKTFADAMKTPKPEKLSDFEKLIKDLPPEQQAVLKQRRAEALAGGDPTGQKAALNEVTQALKQAQLDAIKQKTEAARDKAEATKVADIRNLASGIADTTNAINTAAQAMNMAPNTWLGGTAQAILGNVPWTNQQALSDMVSTLKANQAFGKLLEMKRASPTGASGLGAVSEAELKLLTDNIATLNPTSNNFKAQLTKVINSWTNIRNQMASEYQRLAGRPYDIPSAASTQPEVTTPKSAPIKPTGNPLIDKYLLPKQP